ncbi:hypothetical protein N7540_000088 [Penicillium herquei]|nr:hypothetical protein N7540_000088 [Penicillium herquei]
MELEGSPPDDPILETKTWCESHAPYLEPQVSKSLEKTPPHVHLLSYNQYYNGEELTRYELAAVVTAIHNRVYEKGYQDETSFPDACDRIHF